MRILGLDFGSKTVGVAVSDELLAELTQTNAMDAALLDWVQATI